ncbi:MAG TPA: PEP-CTERM sorting domain-containing protein [Fimbriimonadales bacterium]|nr:PEP-CTERM sorting domain-containing protein [Fimbriimonadales bacterium]
MVRTGAKIWTVITVFSLAAAALADGFVYDVLESHASFIPQYDEDIPWEVDGFCDSQINFYAGKVPVTVGDNTGFSAATVTILYEVDSSACYPVSDLIMVLTGGVWDKGRIFWNEVVEDLSGNVLASADGQILGGGYDGGQDGPFTLVETLHFDHPVEAYKVKKSFFLDIDGDTLPTPSIASLGHIEQNAVPEPATITALSCGIIALLRRRKK